MALYNKLPSGTDFKREYQFHWKLSIDESTMYEKTHEASQKLIKLFNSEGGELVSHVCSLASQVAIPDDEITSEPVKIGEFDYPVPTGVKHGDITVTYLEDSNETVYRFHKYWQSLLRISKDYEDRSRGDVFLLNPLTVLCATATYTSVPQFMNESEAKQYLEKTKRKSLNTGDREQSIKNLFSYNNSDEYDFGTFEKYGKSTSTIYPRVYPSLIKRSNANKQGSSTSTVTVTYSRILRLQHDMGVQYLNNKIWTWEKPRNK